MKSIAILSPMGCGTQAVLALFKGVGFTHHPISAWSDIFEMAPQDHACHAGHLAYKEPWLSKFRESGFAGVFVTRDIEYAIKTWRPHVKNWTPQYDTAYREEYAELQQWISEPNVTPIYYSDLVGDHGQVGTVNPRHHADLYPGAT